MVEVLFFDTPATRAHPKTQSNHARVRLGLCPFNVLFDPGPGLVDIAPGLRQTIAESPPGASEREFEFKLSECSDQGSL